jgi:uncharacterized protein YigE (DUF2233 family)
MFSQTKIRASTVFSFLKLKIGFPLAKMRLAVPLGVMLALLLLAHGQTSREEACRRIAYEDHHFIVCTFDTRQADLRLFWQDPEGKPYGGFSSILSELRAKGETLTFGMNAGMFDSGLAPVGLYIEHGHMVRAANMRNGSGNFHLKPNGVFYIGTKGAEGKSAGVMETSRFLKSGLTPDYATQSGPLLVMDGLVHPKIKSSGTSEKIRNGVGVQDNHIVVFAISEDPVTFFAFASFFRDQLGCPDALYLDGSISSLFMPALERTDEWPQLGPIVGVVEKSKQ